MSSTMSVNYEIKFVGKCINNVGYSMLDTEVNVGTPHFVLCEASDVDDMVRWIITPTSLSNLVNHEAHIFETIGFDPKKFFVGVSWMSNFKTIYDESEN